MASGTVTPPRQGEAPRPQPSDGAPYESFIEQRLHYTRRQVKLVDVLSSVMLLAAATLAFLLGAAVLDHWVVPGGLGFWIRFFLFLAWLGAGTYYFWSRVLPPLVHRINPIYAAQTIEQSRPTLKNSLINFLLLRAHRREVSPVIYHALEQRAAADLSRVPIETAVDRGRMARLGYVLIGVLAAFALYLLFSPKNPLASAARVLWPWSGLEAPTRVHIDDVRPGNTVAYMGDSIKISASIAGLRAGETPMLVFSTADEQIVDQAVSMTAGEGSRYEASLPPGEMGFQQNVSYRLFAGDAKTRPFTIEVQVAPSILVDQIDYHYPPYTEIPDRSVQGRGDILAIDRPIEGTRVTIHAIANQEVKQAEIDLGCAGLRPLRMAAKGKTATAQWTLELNPQDPTRPQYDCYQVLFTDANERTNRRPVRYRIEVVRDQPPDIQITQPTDEDVKVVEDGQLAIRVRAEDDFSLRQVLLKAENKGRPLSIAPLLDQPSPAKPHHGAFEKELVFQPAKLGLKAGDRVTYWAEAEDSKEPNPLRSMTAKRTIEIITADAAQQLAMADQPKPEQPQRADPGDRPKDEQPRQNPQGKDQPKPEAEQPRPEEPKKKPENAGQDNVKPGEKKPRDDSAKPEEKPDGSGQKGNGREGTSQADSESNSNASSQSGGSGGKDQQGLEAADVRHDPVDVEKDPARAVKEILDDANKQQPKQKEGKQDGRGDEKEPTAGAGQQKPDQKPQPPIKQGDEQTSAGGQQKPDQKPQAGSKQGDEQASAGGQQKPDQKPQAGSKQGDEQASAGGQQKPDQKSKPGSKQGDEQASAGGQQKPDQKPGEKSSAQSGTSGQKQPGEKKEKQPGGKQEGSGEKKPDGAKEKAGETQEQHEPGSGRKSQDSAGPTSPQEGNQPRQQDPSNSGEDQPNKQDSQSPSTSPKQSKGQKGEGGDRSGAGDEGGGQRGNQKGTGTAGKSTAADQGGSAANEKGDGETGKKAGEDVKAKHQTGSAKKESGEGEGQRRRDKPSADASAKDSQEQTKQGAESANPATQGKTGGQAGSETSDRPGSAGPGNPTAGNAQGPQADAAPPPPSAPQGEDPANLEFARKQVDLALEHLKDQMKKDKSDLLDRLGWSHDDAKKFLERWQQFKQQAQEPGTQGQAGRKAYNDALKSLGLRPKGTELRGGHTTKDPLQNLRDAGQSEPPPEWLEQFREYTRESSAK